MIIDEKNEHNFLNMFKIFKWVADRNITLLRIENIYGHDTLFFHENWVDDKEEISIPADDAIDGMSLSDVKKITRVIFDYYGEKND